MKTRFHPGWAGRPGFSLIETVLALGIMSLAITALLGLLPHGIEMSRKAANASAQSRIMDQLHNRLVNNSFNNLAAMQDQTLHFDDQGEMLDASNDLRDTVYVARIHIASDSGNTKPLARLPGSTALQNKLLKFQVQIASTPNTAFDFDSAPQNSYQSVPLLVGPFVP